MLFAEMMIGGHNRGEARIGIIFAILGIAISAASAAIVVLRIRVGPVIRIAVVAAWLALSVGGLIGTWDHVRGERDGEGLVSGEALIGTSVATGLPAAVNEAERGSDDKRPPLAPLSFTGLGLLGALAFILGTEPDALLPRRSAKDATPSKDAA
jgi:hypothetical protein